MSRKRVLAVVGTRPEAIKMAPVILELKRRPEEFDLVVKVSGQHRDMLDQALKIFSITPDVDLDIMTAGQTLSGVTCKVLSGMDAYLRETETDIVIVQGDTTTAMASSMACFYNHVALAHVEAGLRTWNCWEPHPEEFNRRVTSLVCAYHLAPTELSAQNLKREGIAPESIHVTGNPVIDALFYVLENTEPPPSPVPDGAPYILMTCHRREIFGAQIQEVFRTVAEYAEAHPDVYIWFPVHPNPNVTGPAHEILGNLPNVVLSKPLDYISFIHAMKGANLVLSDSGGVQEEAPSLGKPVLVLRDRTERPEAAEAGTCLLVGPHRDKILSALERLTNDEEAYRTMAETRNPFGDGTASRQIADILAR